MSNTKTSVVIGVKGNHTDVVVSNVDESSHLYKMGWCGLKDGNVYGVAAFPPKAVDFEETEEKRIKNAVFHCMHFTSKYISTCELSGIKLESDDDSDINKDPDNMLITKQISGSESFVRFPGGMIQYLEKYQYMMDIANKFFETEYNIIANFEFKNKEFSVVPEVNNYKKYINIKVLRSSGVVDDEAILYRTTPIRYSQTNNMMGCTVSVKMKNNELGEKFVCLDNFKKYNPEIFPIKVGLSLSVPSWLKDDRINWKCEMIGYLNNQIGEDYYIIDDNLSVYE
jgi:hypothetical protein